MCIYMTNVKTSAENRHEMYRKKDWYQQQETHIEYHILFWYRGHVFVFCPLQNIPTKGLPGRQHLPPESIQILKLFNERNYINT